MANSNQQQKKQKESPSFTGAYDPNAAKTRQQLDNYDLRATGHNAGSEARLSVKDMQGLVDAGYKKTDIIDYASGLKRVSDVRDSSKENFIGDAAYNLLDTWKSDLMNKGQMDWDGRNKPKEVDDDYSNYINKNIDLKFFVDGAQKQGELQSPKDSSGNLKMGENKVIN